MKSYSHHFSAINTQVEDLFMPGISAENLLVWDIVYGFITSILWNNNIPIEIGGSKD